jgi:hypothetical protein
VVDLWEVLRCDDIAEQIIRSVSESSDVEIIEGAPGSGKSWLAKGVRALWEAGGGSAVVVEGAAIRLSVRLSRSRPVGCARPEAGSTLYMP